MPSEEDTIHEVLMTMMRGNKSVKNVVNSIIEQQCVAKAKDDVLNDITSYIKNKLEGSQDEAQIQQYLNEWIYEKKPDTQTKDQSGGRKRKPSKSKSSKDYVYVLGRNRKITKVGRKSMVVYKGQRMCLTEARALEKRR